MSIVLSAFLALIIMSGIINARSKKKIQSTTLVILSVFYIGSATLIYMSQYE
jgi:hypothetical protein